VLLQGGDDRLPEARQVVEAAVAVAAVAVEELAAEFARDAAVFLGFVLPATPEICAVRRTGERRALGEL